MHHMLDGELGMRFHTEQDVSEPDGVLAGLVKNISLKRSHTL